MENYESLKMQCIQIASMIEKKDEDGERVRLNADETIAAAQKIYDWVKVQ